MFKRFLTSTLELLASKYPIVGIIGPRQSGKSTLARMVFSHLPYVLFEDAATRLLFQSDPHSFLDRYKEGAIFDEVQHVPELLSYLQGVVDISPAKGRFVVTGSQNFVLLDSITQSLAGRIGITTLLPLSYQELGAPVEYMNILFNGGYPRLYDAQIPSTHFFPNYITTYLERDVRSLMNIGDLATFQRFMKLCVARVSQTINYSALAVDAGISHTTAKKWLSVLEASYVIFFVQPFYQNYSKRLIKMPKLYFYDTGLACSLLGLEHESQLDTHYLKGALFENLTILEVVKARYNKGLPAHLYFWRDQSGYEVDLIAEWGGVIKALEIKSGQTFNPDFIKNVLYFSELAKAKSGTIPVYPYVVYGGKLGGKASGVTILPFTELGSIIE